MFTPSLLDFYAWAHGKPEAWYYERHLRGGAMAANVAGAMDTLRDIIKRHWGYDAFLPLQREAMECVAVGRDSLVVLPTGGGKSLCFQAPALAADGMAVVISPLLSLMKDQVDALRTNGIAAARIDSTMTGAERREVHNAIQSRELKLLYVSPERMAQPSFANYLREAGLSFLVVDEAHCISQWGHDFRPEYRELSRLREIFPDKAIHAYTATATPHVRDDIVQELCLREPSILIGSFDRSNLTYHVSRRTDAYGQVREVIDAHRRESGIVYCIRRSEVDGMCGRLVADGYKALPYHAGMDDALRKRNQDAFSREEADIVVATVAFGMGIDKSNVRYVVHAAMPKSIEHYHQETGRAGRDGLSAECRLFYSYADFRLWESIILKSETQAGEIALDKLRDMLQYCEQFVCRHKSLVTYFGQPYDGRSCGACDTCLGHPDALDDAGATSRAILACVAELGAMAGPTYTSLVLTGSKEERVAAKGHDRISSFGALGTFPIRSVRDWIEQLVQQGCLMKSGEYNVLSLTARGAAVLGGEEEARLVSTGGGRTERRARRASTEPLAGLDMELFEELRKARRAKAEELSVPPFIIFGDAALRDMARRKPTTLAGFAQVSGVGSYKCDAFGDYFTTVIRDFLDANPGAEPSAPEALERIPKRERRTAKSRTYDLAATLFARGASIAEASEQLNRRPSTVLEYLEEYIKLSGNTDPTPWVDTAAAERVRLAFKETGAERLRPVFDHLQGEVPYDIIRICAACLNNEAFKAD
jgi:ATP-dependent DNA helicase RecQ